MKNIVIVGSTGSIGTQVLDIVSRLPDKFQIIGLTANGNAKLLAEQAAIFQVPNVSIGDGVGKLEELRLHLSGNVNVFQGVEGMCSLSTLDAADLIVVAVSGAIGIKPTQAALELGKDIALASKEVLVAAGEHTMKLANRTGATILPIDSEHSALFQCIQGAPEKSIQKLQLTASGGPFRTLPIEELRNVTPAQALKHPTWNMGGLVTVNSSTLMNKGLEIIEARWLFDVPTDDVEIIVHPQSIIHSFVRFKDGSILAQLGLPDMRLPIQYALVYPERIDTGLPILDVTTLDGLTFEKPDEDKFPSISIARRAARIGGTMPAVMNAANESAVSQFLDHKITYLNIMDAIQTVMENHKVVDATYDNVLFADEWARHEALRVGQLI